MKKKNLTSLSDFINEKVGPKGSKKGKNMIGNLKPLNLAYLFNRHDKKKE
jgi:hypothetical protein